MSSTGVLDGGWGYITAAYAVVWGGLVLYSLSLALRRRQAERERVHRVGQAGGAP